MFASAGIPGETLLTLVFFLFVFVFAIFTIAIAYHWFTYGNDKKLSMLSFSIYLLLCAPLILTMAISLKFV